MPGADHDAGEAEQRRSSPPTGRRSSSPTSARRPRSARRRCRPRRRPRRRSGARSPSGPSRTSRANGVIVPAISRKIIEWSRRRIQRRISGPSPVDPVIESADAEQRRERGRVDRRPRASRVGSARRSTSAPPATERDEERPLVRDAAKARLLPGDELLRGGLGVGDPLRRGAPSRRRPAPRRGPGARDPLRGRGLGVGDALRGGGLRVGDPLGGGRRGVGDPLRGAGAHVLAFRHPARA